MTIDCNTMRVRNEPGIRFGGPARWAMALEELRRLPQPDLYGDRFDPDWDDAPEPTYWEQMLGGDLL